MTTHIVVFVLVKRARARARATCTCHGRAPKTPTGRHRCHPVEIDLGLLGLRPEA